MSRLWSDLGPIKRHHKITPPYWFGIFTSRQHALVIILVMVDNVWILRYCWWWWWSHFCTLCKPCASLTFVFMADQAPSTAGLVAPLLYLDPEVVPHFSFDVSCILNNLKYKLFSTLWELTPKIAPILFIHILLTIFFQLHSEYRSTYRWHEYTPRQQQVVSRPPQPLHGAGDCVASCKGGGGGA